MQGGAIQNKVGKESLSTVSDRVDALVFSEATEAKAVAKLEDLLEAKVIVRGIERTASGSPIYVEKPDSAIQLAAATKIIEWRKGKPRQMVEVNTTPPNAGSQTMTDLGKLIGRNPDIADKVLAALKEAAKFSQAIPVEAVVSETPATPPESHSGGSPSVKR